MKTIFAKLYKMWEKINIQKYNQYTKNKINIQIYNKYTKLYQMYEVIHTYTKYIPHRVR